MRLDFFLISRKRLTEFLSIVVAVLTALSLFGLWLRYQHGFTMGNHFVRLFYFDSEDSVPTWFSSMLLLIAALLLAVIAAAKSKLSDRYRFHWSGLAFVFLLLSLDEIAGIHEIASDLIKDRADVSGIFYFA